jgi:hypothetical protein
MSNILGIPISNLVRFVDIGGIGDHHCLNFLFIINIFKLTTLVMIGADWIGSCKSNYHTIRTMTVPQ